MAEKPGDRSHKNEREIERKSWRTGWFDHGWTGGQYSIVRGLFGLYLAIHFFHLMPWAGELFSNAGTLSEASLSPFAYVFPNILSFFDAPWFATALVGAAGIASVGFALGIRDKWLALLIWYIGACLFGRNPLISNPALAFVGWMLLFHAALPGTAFGALSARGRTDPAGDWRFPRSFFTVAWLVMGAGYTYSGYTKLISPSWQDGSAIQRVLESPLARVGPVRDLMLSLPGVLLELASWSTLFLELAALPLALIGRLRPWLWLALVSLHIGILMTVAFADLTIGMLLIHLFTFNPAWIAPKRARGPERILYDGTCGLCHGWVRLVLVEDAHPPHRFSFAPLQSEAAQQIFARRGVDRESLPDSILVETAEGELLTRSRAVLHILASLGGLWRLAALIARLIPTPMRDFAYDTVARVRHRLFKRPSDACPLMPPEVRARFLA